MGAPLIASINATWQDGLAMDGVIQVPAPDPYPVRIQGSAPGTPLKIVFDIHSAAKKKWFPATSGVNSWALTADG